MKICFVGLDNLPVLAPEFERLPIGGESVQQTLLARAMMRRGCEVSMVVADRGQPDGAAWSGIRAFNAYRPEAGFPVLRFLHPRWTRMWSALARADADLYYTSCAGMHVGLMALFCRRYRRRFVFRAASDPDCDRARLPLLVRHARDRWLYTYGLRRADAILVQSAVQADALARSYGLPSRIAGMLVDTPPFSTTRDIDVLWVGNIKRVKRPDRILEIAEKLPGARIHVAGGETPGEEPLFEAFSRGVARSPSLVYHGRLPYAAAAALYGRSRLLVNTSDVEGFPNAYLQSWASGVPVVTLIDPDGIIAIEGLGVVARSDSELSAAIGALLGDAASWNAASARCRAYMAREYSEERITTDYLDTFRTVMRIPSVTGRGLAPSRHHV
ncbi:MAG TPA: glycosyltransferase family 4 protein [Burkholderiales bacterium]|nr:glycosyltransferase family 4 protein [Burkholderiales bacterium]